MFLAFIARTELAEVLPRIDPGLVSIAPEDLDRVISDLLDALELVFARRQHREFDRHVRMEEDCLPFAGSAGTFISEILKREQALVRIIPINEQFIRTHLLNLSRPHTKGVSTYSFPQCAGEKRKNLLPRILRCF